jgi:hypothetical protein
MEQKKINGIIKGCLFVSLFSILPLSFLGAVPLYWVLIDLGVYWDYAISLCIFGGFTFYFILLFLITIFSLVITNLRKTEK